MINNSICYCFDDMININNVDLDIILRDEKSSEILYFMKFHTKCYLLLI